MNRPRSLIPQVLATVAAMIAILVVPIGLTASPASATSAITPILNSRFAGTFNTSGLYTPATGETVSGALTKTGNATVSGGLVSVDGGTDGLSFNPAIALGSGGAVTTSVAMEAVVQRTANATLNVDTVLALAGDVDYRWGGSNWRYDSTDVNNTFFQQAAAAPSATSLQHVGLVYTYISASSVQLDLYINGCPAGAALTHTAAADDVINALGFGDEVHPAGLSRGFHGTISAIAAETFTGTFPGAAAFQLPEGQVCHVDAGYLRLGMATTGAVTHLTDTRTGIDYIAPGKTAPLVSLMIDGAQSVPTSVIRSASDPDTYTFADAAAGWHVDVQTVNEGTYTSLTATNETAASGADVQTLLWGPLATDITQTLGESVGIVRDNNFAIGMKPLTDRTEGGWPREELGTSTGWENEVAPNPDDLQVAPNGIEEWSVGARTPWGTLLRAFTFDYTKQRNRVTLINEDTSVPGYPIPVGPLPETQGSVDGSAIALFGTTPDMAPTVLSAIAKDQDLPYPTINGQWQKAAQDTSEPFLVLSDLNTTDVDQAAAYAKAAGIKVIYALTGVDGPWQSAGHYQFNSSFGGSDTAAAALVSQANADGVQVGTHTLSDFINLSDSYVTPTPSPDLAYGQSATLTQNLAVGDTTAYLTNCAPADPGAAGRLVLIDNEFLTYASASMVGGQCQVTGLGHGAWGSTTAAHSSGATATRVLQNEYGGALGGLNLINATATRFASIWNTTGITAMSFDGLESASQAGWGAYGMASLVNGTFAQQNTKDGFISETSRMGSNIWDGLSRASWGEVGSTSMNQVFLNNAFYQDNYLPGMLGWVSLNNSLQTVEDDLARGAGLNAGAGFQTSVSALNSGTNTAAVLDEVKQWTTARNLGAFTAAQRTLFQDQSTHWHLSVVTAGQSWTLQQLDNYGNPVGAAQTVVAPTPAFTTTGLPALAAGRLYEARVATNNPETIKYTVTSGSLPAGLTLDPDTGGITGIPASPTNTTFTITGKGAPGVADAVGTFTTGTLATTPEVALSDANGDTSPGGSLTMTASVSNPGTVAMDGTTATITLPTGWSTSSSTATLGSIAAGATTTASWNVTVASNAPYGLQTSTVSVAYTNGPGDTTASLTVPVSYSSLADTYDNVGVTDDTTPGPGNLDGAGDSYSAQALSSVGVTPGATLAYNGVTFTWPNAASGTKDNTMANGQAIHISGSGTTLAFLGANIGASSGTVTVYYTDGTTSTGTLGFPNWLTTNPTQFGAQPVITTTYRNTPSGPANQGNQYDIYYNSVPLIAGKTVAAVQLPPNLTSLHVFAIGIG